MRILLIASSVLALSACQSTGSGGTADSGGGISSLINVNLDRIRAEIAKNVNLDLDRVPITIQMPITIAANVCGTNVNILTAQANVGDNNCTATATSPELEQEVINQAI